jgi:hypothetical protein
MEPPPARGGSSALAVAEAIVASPRALMKAAAAMAPAHGEAALRAARRLLDERGASPLPSDKRPHMNFSRGRAQPPCSSAARLVPCSEPRVGSGAVHRGRAHRAPSWRAGAAQSAADARLEARPAAFRRIRARVHDHDDLVPGPDVNPRCWRCVWDGRGPVSD